MKRPLCFIHRFYIILGDREADKVKRQYKIRQNKSPLSNEEKPEKTDNCCTLNSYSWHWHTVVSF